MNHQNIYQFMESGEAPSDLTEATLDTLTEQYPWFEGGQILSALYKQKYAKADAQRQLQKAQLYLHNPLWLNWQTFRMNNKYDTAIETADIAIETETENNSSINELNSYSDTLPPKKATNDELTFEPLHAVDYFASQGIKLQQEQIGNDSLGHQVRTFTQWLKTMKKMYHEVPAEAPQHEDIQISQMADASNKNEEVYTETMADVLKQQGKKRQAIAVYEKLSLLHPEKSSYFTSRIAEINE
jgi:tetratricopeptide (TPR) repeat protein